MHVIIMRGDGRNVTWYDVPPPMTENKKVWVRNKGEWRQDDAES
jgi:hypothetical protein